MKRTLSWEAVTWTVRVLISIWIVLIFFHSPGVNGYDRAEFHDMVAGTAYRPFVTRALMPWAIRAFVAATPEKVKNAIEHNALTDRLKQTSFVSRELQWTPYCYEYLVAFFLSVFCLVAFSHVCASLWQFFFTPARPYAEVCSIVALLGLPPFFKYYSYIYDFPSLFLYTLCLYLMAKRKWWVYFPVFVLACISKETAALLPFVFAFYYIAHHRDDRARYWSILTGQVLLAVFIRGVIAYVYRDNPGAAVEFHFIDHNSALLASPYSVQTLATYVLLFAAVMYQWRTKPWFLRAAVSMLVPLLVSCLFFGFLDELRDYYEIYAAALMLGAASFLRLLGHPITTSAPTSAFAAPRIFDPGPK
jgi:hypothetical protein